jgi:sugar porter (SP) family MFS transporter
MMAGALGGGILADRFGRRTVLVFTTLTLMIFTIFNGLADSYNVFLISRFLVGFNIGIIITVTPVYISEFARTKVRGRLGGSFQLAVSIGLTVSYWIDFLFVKTGNWHAMFIIGAIPCAILTVLLFGMPDSPRWYFIKGLEQKGREALARIYSGPEEVEAATKLIQEELRSTSQISKGSYTDLLKPGIRMALFFAIGLTIFQMLTGINTLTTYQPIIFTFAGYTKANAVFMTGAIGIITNLATLAGIVLIDSWGRRPLAFISTLGMAVSMAGIGLSFFLGQHIPNLGILTVGSVIVCHIAFAMGLGMMSWVWIPEIFPNRTRSRAQSVAKFAGQFANFAVTGTFLSLMNALGPGYTFWLFAALSLCALLFLFKFGPETSHRPLESIEGYWLNGRKWESAAAPTEPVSR